MTRVAIIAAMPGELKPLVQRWQHEGRNGVELWRIRSADGEWIAACAGMGQQNATRAFAEVEKDGRIDRAISTGWAGALRRDVKTGRAYYAAGVVDLKTGERFPLLPATRDIRWLVTSPRVVGAKEKEILQIDYYAGMVDMEAAAIARLAKMRGIPFACIKGVSDGLDDNLPDFNRFISRHGQPNLARLLFFVLPRPWHWPALIRMGENSKQASQAIRELLLENLEKPGATVNQDGDTNLSR
ncbi:MAG TPA: nucleoside phosphorylase [Terracidiphilus sp.]|nr:nucleoside phosphorylase [Terracidiphilus sp.]